MPNDDQPRDELGRFTFGDGGGTNTAGDKMSSAIQMAASDIKKQKKAKLKAHLNLLNERLVEGGIGKKERRLIEKRIENMSGEILSLMD